MFFSRENLIRFIKFGIVGGLGTVINLGFFYAMVDTLGLISANVGSVLGFLIAVTSNYLLNSFWTFNDGARSDAGGETEGDASDGAAPVIGTSFYLKYVAINIVGLGLNLIALNIIISLFDPRPQVIAQAGGIASAMLANFLLSKIFVFDARKSNT